MTTIFLILSLNFYSLSLYCFYPIRIEEKILSQKLFKIGCTNIILKKKKKSIVSQIIILKIGNIKSQIIAKKANWKIEEKWEEAHAMRT